ncbi:hypothetical protein ACFE04_018788 [Oxalis oulophora]
MNSNSVKEFVKKEVADWDDDVISTARFKAFSGQRSDWEPKFHFWRDLILKVATNFDLFIIKPSQVKNDWFNRGGLTPLCLDQALSVMCEEGDVVRIGDLLDPTTSRFSLLLRIFRNFMARSAASQDIILEDRIILAPLLKEKSSDVIKQLSESHWTSSCVITLKKFQDVCGGRDEASAVLSYLVGCGKALYLSVKKKEPIEGVKVSLSPVAVSSVSSLDCDVLHLIWTTEKLQQQIDVIDRRYELSKQSALASLKSGNKKIALRHTRELKLASESREKCTSFLNRVEGVLNTIADAESSKKAHAINSFLNTLVSEAILIGARAIKENKISVEEVEICLEELEESIDLQKQVEKSLESTSSYQGIDDDEVEEEFKKLELEMEWKNPEVLLGSLTPRREKEEEISASESAGSLSDALANLKLADSSSRNRQKVLPRMPETTNQKVQPLTLHYSKIVQLESE